jgi:hypothetical protein
VANLGGTQKCATSARLTSTCHCVSSDLIGFHFGHYEDAVTLTGNRALMWIDVVRQEIGFLHDASLFEKAGVVAKKILPGGNLTLARPIGLGASPLPL